MARARHSRQCAVRDPGSGAVGASELKVVRCPTFSPSFMFLTAARRAWAGSRASASVRLRAASQMSNLALHIRIPIRKDRWRAPHRPHAPSPSHDGPQRPPEAAEKLSTLRQHRSFCCPSSTESSRVPSSISFAPTSCGGGGCVLDATQNYRGFELALAPRIRTPPYDWRDASLASRPSCESCST